MASRNSVASLSAIAFGYKSKCLGCVNLDAHPTRAAVRAASIFATNVRWLHLRIDKIRLFMLAFVDQFALFANRHGPVLLRYFGIFIHNKLVMVVP